MEKQREIKHTPVPWIIDNTFGRPRIFVNHNGNKKVLFNASGDCELEEAQANAKLIALAPDLLKERDQLKEELTELRKGSFDEAFKTCEEIRELKEENERLKQWKLEAEEQLDLQHELNKQLKEKDFYKEFTNAFEVNQKLIIELDSLKQLNSELVEALENSKQVIENLIAGKRIVNLDEALAFYETLLSKTKAQTS